MENTSRKIAEVIVEMVGTKVLEITTIAAIEAKVEKVRQEGRTSVLLMGVETANSCNIDLDAIPVAFSRFDINLRKLITWKDFWIQIEG